MAITKTWVYGTDGATGFALLYDYLVANAVPEYFDSVIMSEDNTHILCYIDDHVFLDLGKDNSASGWVVTTTTGMTIKLSPAYTNMRAHYGYKCKNGIILHVTEGSSADYFPLFTITKSHNGETTIVTAKNISNSSIGSSQKYYAIALNDNEIVNYTMFNASRPLTVLCPIPTGCTYGEGNYTDNVLYMPFYQTQSVGELEINGVRYFSNGVWVVKDE